MNLGYCAGVDDNRDRARRSTGFAGTWDRHTVFFEKLADGATTVFGTVSLLSVSSRAGRWRRSRGARLDGRGNGRCL